MNEKRYEYRIVSHYIGTTSSDMAALSGINELAREGFRVIACAGDNHGFLCWTLEREVPPSTPYRG